MQSCVCGRAGSGANCSACEREGAVGKRAGEAGGGPCPGPPSEEEEEEEVGEVGSQLSPGGEPVLGVWMTVSWKGL